MQNRMTDLFHVRNDDRYRSRVIQLHSCSCLSCDLKVKVTNFMVKLCGKAGYKFKFQNHTIDLIQTGPKIR